MGRTLGFRPQAKTEKPNRFPFNIPRVFLKLIAPQGSSSTGSYLIVTQARKRGSIVDYE